MIKNTNSNWNWNHCGLCSNELSTSSGGRTTAKNSSNITSAKAKRCALGWKKLKSQKEGDFSPLKSNHTLELTPIFRLRLTSIAPATILQKNSVLVLGMCNPLFNVCVHAHWTPNIPFFLLLVKWLVPESLLYIKGSINKIQVGVKWSGIGFRNYLFYFKKISWILDKIRKILPFLLLGKANYTMHRFL